VTQPARCSAQLAFCRCGLPVGHDEHSEPHHCTDAGLFGVVCHGKWRGVEDAAGFEIVALPADPFDVFDAIGDRRLPGLAGMTVAQAVHSILLAGRRHGDVPPEVCGAIDPRSEHETKWCQRPGDGRCERDGQHCSWRDPQEWAEA
jgi:hypothetical protein